MTDRIMQDLAKLQTENRKYKEQVKGYVQKLLSRDEEIVKLKKQISDNELKEKMVKMATSVATKEDAIVEVGQLLVSGGYIDSAYINSMFGREEISNTYLGNGICIPHGLQENRNLILNTGIAVLQIPEGVEWKDGEKAHIVVGIAAKTDEHIQILAQLTNLLTDEEEAKKLAITDDVNLILNTLNAEKKEDKNTDDVVFFETKKEVIYPGHAGFHARPASLFVENSQKFEFPKGF